MFDFKVLLKFYILFIGGKILVIVLSLDVVCVLFVLFFLDFSDKLLLLLLLNIVVSIEGNVDLLFVFVGINLEVS